MATATEAHPGDKHEIPEYEAHESTTSLKERIKKHYEIASDYYYSLWGQHIHHGYFKSPTETKEEAQVNLINYLLEISGIPRGAHVLDVGCGLGGTSRFLAKERACAVTGITISGRQVEIARKLTRAEIATATGGASGTGASPLPADTGKAVDADTEVYPSAGSCRFIELDAEKMLDHFSSSPSSSATATTTTGDTKVPLVQFDAVWITEALSHFPDKPLFFRSAFALLASRTGTGTETETSSPSRLVIADWFRAPQLTPDQERDDIRPIEDGMLLPRLCTADEYVEMAQAAGFRVYQGPIDISGDVARTWDISWELISSPSLWLFAISQGRDGLAFLQAFRAMRRGYANGTFRYAIMCFKKL